MADSNSGAKAYDLVREGGGLDRRVDALERAVAVLEAGPVPASVEARLAALERFAAAIKAALGG